VWTALETSIQEALEDNSIGYSFKKLIEAKSGRESLPPLPPARENFDYPLIVNT
jgi:hypothetical protein